MTDMTVRAVPDSATISSTSWQPGQSGNPAGRPKGSRNQSHRLIELLLDGDAQALTRKVIELALNGDTTALKMCLDRLSPARRTRAIQFDLPATENAADIARALSAVLQATACGELDTEQAQAIAEMLELKRKTLETVELEERVARLESPKIEE